MPYGTTFLHGKASHLVLRSLSLPYEPSSLATPLCGVSPAERARGNAFLSPARAVVWFYHNGALYFFRGAHQDLCSLSDSDATLGPCVSTGPYAPLRPTAAGPFGNTAAPPTGIYQQMIPYGRLPQPPPSTTHVVPLPRQAVEGGFKVSASIPIH